MEILRAACLLPAPARCAAFGGAPCVLWWTGRGSLQQHMPIQGFFCPRWVWQLIERAGLRPVVVVSATLHQIFVPLTAVLMCQRWRCTGLSVKQPTDRVARGRTVCCMLQCMLAHTGLEKSSRQHTYACTCTRLLSGAVPVARLPLSGACVCVCVWVGWPVCVGGTPCEGCLCGWHLPANILAGQRLVFRSG